ncbi:MAG: D-sedoheptulose 7-phosphate isomerase [Acidobacteria bacterium]|nr:D-sedoheptulose 7-phosphate isomerase [Acidobacteriota bacterium]MCZ6751624.1 D-sedoheptulose 7-phosphate isomerase [Acidobacteriota bacterium]
MMARVEKELEESCRVKQQFSVELKKQIVRLAEQVAAALDAGGTVFLIGNGGSAADAQHIAAELVVRLGRSRRALAAVALTTNTSTLTAIANDNSYDEVFSRQVEAFVRPGDVLIGLSTSGNSKNVLRGLEEGNRKKALTVGWTGESGGKLPEVAALCLRIPSSDTQRIQECHITIGHILCGMVEDLIASKPQASPPKMSRTKRLGSHKASAQP